VSSFGSELSLTASRERHQLAGMREVAVGDVMGAVLAEVGKQAHDQQGGNY
jgi:hypothetical protein